MRRPKITHRFLHLLALAAVFAAGWWLRGVTDLRRQHGNHQREEQKREAYAILISASHINYLNEHAWTQSPENEQRLRTFLVGQLARLAVAEKWGDESNNEMFLLHAANTLNHLGAENWDELQMVVNETSLVDRVKQPFIDSGHEKYPVMREFVDRALAYDWPPGRW